MVLLLGLHFVEYGFCPVSQSDCTHIREGRSVCVHKYMYTTHINVKIYTNTYIYKLTHLKFTVPCFLESLSNCEKHKYNSVLKDSCQIM